MLAKQDIFRREKLLGCRMVHARRRYNLASGGKKKATKKKKKKRVKHVLLFLTTRNWHREIWEKWRGQSKDVAFLIHHKEDAGRKRFHPYSTEKTVPTAWGDIVPAQVLLLEEGLQKYPNAVSFTFVSGECIPVAPIKDFRATLKLGSIMPHDIVPWSDLVQQQTGSDYACYGHTWISLSRQHARTAVKTPTEYYQMKAKPLPGMTHSLEPDEYAIHTHVLNEYQAVLQDLLTERKRSRKNRKKLRYPRGTKGQKQYPNAFYDALADRTQIRNNTITNFVQMVANNKPQQHPITYKTVSAQLMKELRRSKKEGYLMFRKVKVNPVTVAELKRRLPAIWRTK